MPRRPKYDSRTIDNNIDGVKLTDITDDVETTPGGQTEVFVVEGTVKNTTDQPLKVMLEATFYASDDDQLRKATAYVPEMNAKLQPRSEASFRLSHETNANDIGRYTLTVQPPG